MDSICSGKATSQCSVFPVIRAFTGMHYVWWESSSPIHLTWARLFHGIPLNEMYTAILVYYFSLSCSEVLCSAVCSVRATHVYRRFMLNFMFCSGWRSHPFGSEASRRLAIHSTVYVLVCAHRNALLHFAVEIYAFVIHDETSKNFYRMHYFSFFNYL